MNRDFAPLLDGLSDTTPENEQDWSLLFSRLEVRAGEPIPEDQRTRICEKLYELGEGSAAVFYGGCYFHESIAKFMENQLGRDALAGMLEQKGGKWALHNNADGQLFIFTTNEVLREQYSTEVDYGRQMAGIV